MTFWPWLQSRQYQSQKCSFNDFLALVPETDDFLALAPEADKIRFRSLDWMAFWPWLQMSTNHSQGVGFDDFMSLAPEVDKIIPRRFDLMTLWPWPQKSTKSIPEVSICWLSGLASRRQQSQSQKSWFNDSLALALAPEVNKISPRSFDLLTFWPWLQKSTKSVPEALI